MQQQHITSVIIPAAGFGTRFAPITTFIPKELLPVNNKPALEYILQEMIDTSITNIHTIISPAKEVIRSYCQSEYFTKPYAHLPEVQASKKRMERCNFTWHYQHKQAGLADALLQAQHAVKDTFFAVALPDDIFTDSQDLANMIALSQTYHAHVVAVQQVPQNRVNRYGIIAPQKDIDSTHGFLHFCIEKPEIQQAPSNLAIIGRYIFHKSLFTHITQTPPSGQEILLPETINRLAKIPDTPVMYYQIKGSRFDTGTPETWRECVKKI